MVVVTYEVVYDDGKGNIKVSPFVLRESSTDVVAKKFENIYHVKVLEVKEMK